MRYVLTGVNQSQNTRLFAFDRVGDDRTRTEFTVGVDISLIRTYAISLQELPLLCRRFLEERVKPTQTSALTEAEMAEYARRRAAAAGEERKPKRHRRPSSNRVGWAWRNLGPSPPPSN